MASRRLADLPPAERERAREKQREYNRRRTERDRAAKAQGQATIYQKRQRRSLDITGRTYSEPGGLRDVQHEAKKLRAQGYRTRLPSPQGVPEPASRARGGTYQGPSKRAVVFTSRADLDRYLDRGGLGDQPEYYRVQRTGTGLYVLKIAPPSQATRRKEAEYRDRQREMNRKLAARRKDAERKKQSRAQAAEARKAAGTYRGRGRPKKP